MARKQVKKADAVPASEFSDTFVQAMYDRMAVSFFKYGKVAEAYPKKAEAIKSLLQRLALYCGLERLEAGIARIKADTTFTKKLAPGGSGNTEFLVDAGNFAMIEFMRPAHPDAHFRPTDSHESPGRVMQSGLITAKHNLDLK